MSLAKTAQLSSSKLDKDLLYMIDEDLSVDEDEKNDHEGEVVMLVSEDDKPEEEEITSFELPSVPGAEDQSEVELSVEEEPEVEVSSPAKWDWKSHGLNKALPWIKERMDNPPTHNGKDSVGLERCIAHYEKLDREISSMVRYDIDGILNINLVEKAREEIHKCIDRLSERLNIVNSNKFKKKKKKADDESEDGFVKEAQKAAGVYGRIQVQVPLLISSLAREIVNGTISSGKDAEQSFKVLAERYKLTDREHRELTSLLSDMGFPIKHRDYNGDASSEENIDYIAQYYA